MGSPNRLLVLLLPFLGGLVYARTELDDALEALVERDAEPEYKAYISTMAEYNTECKKCPRSLCPNTKYYGYNDEFNVTCWTRGTKIMDDKYVMEIYTHVRRMVVDNLRPTVSGCAAQRVAM